MKHPAPRDQSVAPDEELPRQFSATVPFRTELSLAGVIAKWRQDVPEADPDRQFIEGVIARHPELLQPVANRNFFEPHQEFLRRLFSPLLPVKSWITSANSLCAPFDHNTFLYATEAYRRIYEADEVEISSVDSLMKQTRIDGRVLYAYKSILKQLYGLDLKVDLPIIFSSRNTKTGLQRYFKLTGNTRFTEVVPLAPLPDLPRERLQKLLDQDFDLDSWMDVLPPENFLFRGVTLTSLVDITIEEATKRLQVSLLSRQDVSEDDWMKVLQGELRNLFRLPQLRLGVATLQKNGELNVNSRRKIWNSLLLRETAAGPETSLPPSLYGRAIAEGQTVIVENLADLADDPVVAALVGTGYHNLLLAPLQFEGETVGLLELANPEPGAINGLSLFKIRQITPIFANALKRHLEEFESKVEAVMLEEFTAIHPAIQWRFREAAIRHLDGSAVRDSIVFENLSPFFGSLDIRDSSKKRNRAIYLDLMENLEAAGHFLQDAVEAHSIDVLKALSFQIDRKLDRLRDQFAAEDEAGLAEFIRAQVNPVIGHLSARYADLAPTAEAYLARTGGKNGIFHRNRMAYDCALEALNRGIARRLDQEEAALQRLVPCIFEKYQTDGVEYNIYLGQSLAPQSVFDELYVENLQLRQLIWTCEIVRAVRRPVEEPDRDCPGAAEAVHLEIAPLVLAYGSRITLKFQLDQKRLDVDGSYNVRYEIIKKRIDKALIKDTRERLTQPDQLVVVYTQDRDAAAYQRHFEYLRGEGYISEDWEMLELEPLQGVKGLRALRVAVR